jgi:TRAP-type C4-dicarboxylate transport system substrate-binding protein
MEAIARVVGNPASGMKCLHFIDWRTAASEFLAADLRMDMFANCLRMIAVALVLLPAMASAEPIKLKLSYYTSDREVAYRIAVKPFVDSVNAAAKGLLEIEVFTSGSLGKSYPGQLQLVLDGVADIAFVNPALTPARFPDDAVFELPGLFRDAREASFVYTRLLAAGALRGYEDFFVVGSLDGGPQSIHVRPPISSLKDLQGKKIRTSNQTEAAVLNALGMAAEVMPLNRTAEAISRGAIDGTTAPPVVLIEFGISRVASYHYDMRLGFAPLLILMNKKKFDSLPNASQDIIRKFSGEWLTAHFLETFDTINDLMLEQLKSDPKRTFVVPSAADFATAQAVFASIRKEWVAASPHNRALLTQVEAEISKLRNAE